MAPTRRWAKAKNCTEFLYSIGGAWDTPIRAVLLALLASVVVRLDLPPSKGLTSTLQAHAVLQSLNAAYEAQPHFFGRFVLPWATTLAALWYVFFMLFLRLLLDFDIGGFGWRGFGLRVFRLDMRLLLYLAGASSFFGGGGGNGNGRALFPHLGPASAAERVARVHKVSACAFQLEALLELLYVLRDFVDRGLHIGDLLGSSGHDC